MLTNGPSGTACCPPVRLALALLLASLSLSACSSRDASSDASRVIRIAFGIGPTVRASAVNVLTSLLYSEPLIAHESNGRPVAGLAESWTWSDEGRTLTLVSVLKGSLPFMADLMRAIDLPLRIDLMEVSSYGGATTESSGLVRILKDLSASIAGEDVLIVEDIIDTGLTLNYLIRYLRGKNPATLRICTLLDKPARRLVDIPVDYRGFTIPDQFVVGYGLDYGELYRNLRFVGVLKPEVYSQG